MITFIQFLAGWLSFNHHEHWADILLSGQFDPAQFMRWFDWGIDHGMPLP